jgi:hypothetical protein
MFTVVVTPTIARIAEILRVAHPYVCFDYTLETES